MGPRFFEHIGQRTREYGNFRIVNSVQTNATLLTSEFIDIFVKYNFRIGLSLDGPRSLHDLTRRTSTGTSTFDTVIDSIDLARASGISIGAIAVLTKQNLDHMVDIYDFFSQRGIHFRVNPIQRKGKAATNYAEIALTPKEYGREMIRLFDMWYADDETGIIVDPFRLIIGNILTGKILSCEFRRCHNEMISISPDGGAYPCGIFTGVAQYCLGNILTERMHRWGQVLLLE
ncbi:MAG: radical SAM protein [Pseudomonadota bacterium]